jgi:protein gp37
MAEKSNIAWTDSTLNAWIGCTKVSPGCANCYADAQDKMRFSRNLGGGTKQNPITHWGKGVPRYKVAGFVKDALALNRKPFVKD